MTRDDIIRLREECDQWAEQHLQCKGEYHPDFHTVSDERFAALVAAAERERACRIVTGLCISDNNAREINEAIRANAQA
jgi:hypothetical protein